MPIRVLMVSTTYPVDASDWRGTFIRNLVAAIACLDEVQLSLWAPAGDLPEKVDRAALPAEAKWLDHLMREGGIAHLIRTGGVRGLGRVPELLRMLRNLYRRGESADVYHVNWLQNALPLPRNDRPLLVTVLGTDMQLLKVPGMTQLLRRVFHGRRVAICPNAQWMEPALEPRVGDLATIRYVPFGIEPRWFEVQREPAKPSRWLCVSRLTKGKIGTLFQWGEPFFAHGSRELHLFGPMQQEMPVPAWVHYHGPATANDLCNEWFPQAQGLITLSQHAEGRPQVMLEAMAAGLPIVASDIPAHRDMLESGKAGWLCGSASDVESALADLANAPLNNQMGQRAREWAKLEIGSWDDCALRFLDLYKLLTRA